jgi:hypothetical protein
LSGGKRRGGLGDLREGLTDGIDEEGRPESSGGRRTAAPACVPMGAAFQWIFGGQNQLPGRGLSARSFWWCLSSLKVNEDDESATNTTPGGGPAAPSGEWLQRAAQGRDRRGARLGHAGASASAAQL